MGSPAKGTEAGDVSDNDVSRKDESNFRCPACRARQPLQNRCRRCQADLSLVVLAHQRLNYLLTVLDQAVDPHAPQIQLLRSELKLLAPRCLPF